MGSCAFWFWVVRFLLYIDGFLCFLVLGCPVFAVYRWVLVLFGFGLSGFCCIYTVSCAFWFWVVRFLLYIHGFLCFLVLGCPVFAVYTRVLVLFGFGLSGFCCIYTG